MILSAPLSLVYKLCCSSGGPLTKQEKIRSSELDANEPKTQCASLKLLIFIFSFILLNPGRATLVVIFLGQKNNELHCPTFHIFLFFFFATMIVPLTDPGKSIFM